LTGPEEPGENMRAEAGHLLVRRGAAVEGIPGWVLLAGYALFGLMGLAVLPALTAVGFLLAGHPLQARGLFATALLCEAILCAALCFLLLWTDWGFDLRRGYRLHSRA
jgi:hypothetical protein